MKRIILIILAIFLSYGEISATMQVPDLIIYKNNKWVLRVHGSTSPLQVYYLVSKNPYPFKMIGTSNYRGFIAKWAIVDNTLYLKDVSIRSRKVDLKRLFGEEVIDDRVKASWFSGILLIYKTTEKASAYVAYIDKKRYFVDYSEHTFLEIENGIMKDEYILDDFAFEELRRNYFSKKITNENHRRIYQKYLLYRNKYYKD